MTPPLQISRHYQELTQRPSQERRRAVVGIGNFDGLHRGHQALIRAVERAVQEGGAPRDRIASILTFDPHPLRFFRRAPNPQLIYSVTDRVSLLNHVGIEQVLLQRFDEAFARLTPEAFVTQVLIDALCAQHVVVGHDFAFGAKRAGKVDTLVELCARHQVRVEVIEAQLAPEVAGRAQNARPLSSSWIRELLTQGRVKEAARYLGRPYHVRGVVRRGHQRGRQLGFPTANLELLSEICPQPGVYAGWLSWGEGPKASVISVGNNPTFTHDHKLVARQPWSVEVHVLSTERHQRSERSLSPHPLNVSSPSESYSSSESKRWLELYDLPVSLWFTERLRDVISFQSLEDLKHQISADSYLAHQRLASLDQPLWPSDMLLLQDDRISPDDI